MSLASSTVIITIDLNNKLNKHHYTCAADPDTLVFRAVELSDECAANGRGWQAFSWSYVH